MNFSNYPYRALQHIHPRKASQYKGKETNFIAKLPGKQLSQEDQVWLKEFSDHIQSNLSNELLTVPQLAEEFAMSQSSLFRRVKRLTGLSPKQYLIEMRMNHARHLFEQNIHNTISKVAYVVGYSNAITFSRAFKRHFGQIPSAFIQ